MPTRILPIIFVVLSICGCVSQNVIERTQAAADSAARDAAVAQSTADQALSAAMEAQYAAEANRELLERSSQGPPGPPGGPVGQQVLVPNSEYVSRDEPRYRVWYGTHRALKDLADPAKGFSNADGGKLIYGRAIVYVPKSHSFGETGSSWIIRKIFRKDDRLKIQEMTVLSENDFRTYMEWKLASRASGKRTAFVYVHGYNTEFEEAIIRAAQIGYDLKIEGVTALFSWPSKGSTFGYTADEATIQSSEPYLEQFLMSIISNPEVEEVNVLAHSMGNRALLRVVEKLAGNPALPPKPINQIILAAPDVDVRIFEQLAKYYPQVSERTTIYVSAEDRALELSGWLHQFQRVGKAPPVNVLPDIDTIAVDEIDVSALGHTYFAEAHALLYDIFDLLRSDADPDYRQRLRSATNEKGQKFWFFAK
jgi:esterase/lipase superfamily enzyme